MGDPQGNGDQANPHLTEGHFSQSWVPGVQGIGMQFPSENQTYYQDNLHGSAHPRGIDNPPITHAQNPRSAAPETSACHLKTMNLMGSTHFPGPANIAVTHASNPPPASQPSARRQAAIPLSFLTSDQWDAIVKSHLALCITAQTVVAHFTEQESCHTRQHQQQMAEHSQGAPSTESLVEHLHSSVQPQLRTGSAIGITPEKSTAIHSQVAPTTQSLVEHPQVAVHPQLQTKSAIAITPETVDYEAKKRKRDTDAQYMQYPGRKRLLRYWKKEHKKQSEIVNQLSKENHALKMSLQKQMFRVGDGDGPSENAEAAVKNNDFPAQT